MSTLETEALNWEKLAIHALSDPERLRAGDDSGSKILFVKLLDAPGFDRLHVTLINPMTPSLSQYVTILKIEGVLGSESFVCRILYGGVYFLPDNKIEFPKALKVVLENRILIDELEERVMIYLLSRE